MGRDLRIVAVGVGVVGAIGVNIAQFITQRLHRSRDYCQLPLKVLNNNPQALELLGGGPAQIKKLDLRHANFNPREAKLIVPVAGKKRGGEIYTFSSRPDNKSEWTLQYAVMKIRKDEYKWNIWLHPDDGIDSNTDILPDDVQEALL